MRAPSTWETHSDDAETMPGTLLAPTGRQAGSPQTCGRDGDTIEHTPDDGRRVAGGMSRKSDGFPRETLAQRVENTRARTGGHSTQDAHGTRTASWTAPAPTTTSPISPPPPLRHCWYRSAYGLQPALLLRWRNVGGHYDGLIIVAAPDKGGTGWAVVEIWTDSALLSPA